MTKSVVTLLAAVVLTAGPALMAQSKTGSSDRMSGPGSPDQSFMMKAAQGGMAEVEMGSWLRIMPAIKPSRTLDSGWSTITAKREMI